MSEKRDYLRTPSVLEEDYQGIREIDLNTKLFSDDRPKIFLTGEVTDRMADDFVAELMYLKQAGIKGCDLIINSSGGSCSAGLVIADIIEEIKAKETMDISAYVCGLAASMAAVILCCIKKGNRFALPHSKVLIHEPLISGGMGGSATSIKSTAESILETKAVLNEILARNTGHSVEEINEATSFDNMMTAEQALEFGLIDAIKSPF